ncbi:hypothetical protein PG996_011127 [Apiospora saccharicola]|uniref:Uncharacterized protein n=1 Tax=Apiospora saccharicola TaxID=335842 RepID=A0ABR1UE59_9PEZI
MPQTLAQAWGRQLAGVLMLWDHSIAEVDAAAATELAAAPGPDAAPLAAVARAAVPVRGNWKRNKQPYAATTTSSSPIPVAWGNLALGTKGIPVWLSWLQLFGLIDWTLGWMRRVFLAQSWGRRVAGWTMLWDHSVLEAAAAAAAPPGARLAASERWAQLAETNAAAAELAARRNPDAEPLAAVTAGELELAKKAATHAANPDAAPLAVVARAAATLARAATRITVTNTSQHQPSYFHPLRRGRFYIRFATFHPSIANT